MVHSVQFDETKERSRRMCFSWFATQSRPSVSNLARVLHCTLYTVRSMAVRYVHYVPTVLLPSPLCQGNTAFAPQTSYLKSDRIPIVLSTFSCSCANALRKATLPA